LNAPSSPRSERTLLHLGLGSFHRAHQAVYLHRLIESGDASWVLAGGNIRPDMSDTLAVAVSQSGTTTDTNRTVDLLRSRGAAVIGIVNRRGSDLTDKADGVLYTSDGRDVEMAVPSTKAFYAQIAAGFLLALAMADEAFATIGYPPSKLEAVLNRSDSTGGFTKADVEEALNRRIEHEVVSDGKLVIAANNEGVPFVLANPDAPVSQGVRAMAASLSARLPSRQAVLARR